ncbi:MAG: ribonuclease H-like domain-containing protein [Candidatus Paceibacterota bacterium]|jgi:DEAD/DEAH box helicase domain-containing protein
MHFIVFDTETRNIFADVGSNEAKDLDLSVVCIYDSRTGEYSSFTQETLPKLWPILESADVIIGYNQDHFDIPLLNKYYSGDLTKIKSLDLLKEIKNVLGFRLKLDSVAEATLGIKKSAHGLQAVAWWKEGKVDEIIKYCIQDVKVTKEIYEYALKNSHLKFKDGNEIREIKLDTSKWQNKSDNSKLTYTLPF